MMLAAVAVGLSLWGCSHHSEKIDRPAPRPDSAISLQITNHHYLDITIYAVHDGQRTRLGIAGGSGSTVLSLPVRLLGVGREVRLLGDPVGSTEQPVTEIIVVQPGQYVEWLLESNLLRSTVEVY